MDFDLPLPYPELDNDPKLLHLTIPTADGNIVLHGRDHKHLILLIQTLVKDLTASLELVRKHQPDILER